MKPVEMAPKGNKKNTNKLTRKNMRNRLYERSSSLMSERSSWLNHYQELSTYLLPYTGRFVTTKRNEGNRKHNAIYDNTATRALRVLGAGMMAGATSPARPWFALETPDPELNKHQAVKLYLDEVTDLMRAVFARSNTYQFLHQCYEELGLYGTHCNLLLPDYNNVIHNYSLTAGQYTLSTDYQGNVNTMFREFEKTVSEMVREFGKENVSQTVRNLHDRGVFEAPVKIIHCIEPRDDREMDKMDAVNMAYGSYYFEQGADDDRFLRESGFETFPVLAPRWAVSGDDVYGNSPAMECLGDTKQLQHQQLRKAQAIDYQTNPPLQVPTNLKARDLDRLPGGVTYVDAQSAQSGIRSAFEVNLNLDYLLNDIQDTRERIRSGFYADLFLMLTNATDTRMTATEVAERHEEKLLMLGPVMERLHQELLEPLIERTFERMAAAGILPEAPEELEGMELNVNFVSMLAQAQRAVGTNSVDRFIGGLGSVAQFNPEILDKFDADAYADEYANMLGVDPKLIIPTDEAIKVRQARADMQAKQAQAEAAAQQAATARDMSAAASMSPEEQPNVIDMFSGYNS